MVAVMVGLGLLACAGTWKRPLDHEGRKWLRHADRAMHDGRWIEAARWYDKTIARYPATVPPRVYGWRAMLYLSSGDTDRAAALLEEHALVAYPDNAEIEGYLAFVEHRRGNKDRSLDLAERALDGGSRDCALNYIVGTHRHTRPRRAVRLLSIYLTCAVPPDIGRVFTEPLVRLHLGFAALRTSQFPLAQWQFEWLLANEPTGRYKHNAVVGMCAAMAGQERYSDAIQWCTEALALGDSSNGASSYNLATSLWKAGRAREATRPCLDYLRVRPDRPKGYCLCASVFFDQGDQEAGRKLARSARFLGGCGQHGWSARVTGIGGTAPRSLDP